MIVYILTVATGIFGHLCYGSCAQDHSSRFHSIHQRSLELLRFVRRQSESHRTGIRQQQIILNTSIIQTGKFVRLFDGLCVAYATNKMSCCCSLVSDSPLLHSKLNISTFSLMKTGCSRFLPLAEAVDSRALFVIVSGSDRRTGGNIFRAS